MVVLGLVGMHQMTFGHDTTLGPTAASAVHGEHVDHIVPIGMLPMTTSTANTPLQDYPAPVRVMPARIAQPPDGVRIQSS